MCKNKANYVKKRPELLTAFKHSFFSFEGNMLSRGDITKHVLLTHNIGVLIKTPFFSIKPYYSPCLNIWRIYELTDERTVWWKHRYWMNVSSRIETWDVCLGQDEPPLPLPQLDVPVAPQPPEEGDPGDEPALLPLLLGPPVPPLLGSNG